MKSPLAWFRRLFTWLKCCKCGRLTHDVKIVCERCGHRYCETCRGEKKAGTS